MATSVPLFPTNYYFLNLLAAAINPAAPAPLLLGQGKMMLGQNFFNPGLLTTYALLNEATFDGYAQSATIVWGTPINDVDTTPTSISPSHLFRMTGVTTPNTIQSLAVTDGVAPPATGILASGSFAPGLGFGAIGDGLSVQVDWNLGNYPGNLNATLIR